MKVIKPFENFQISTNDIAVFLAGGITNCRNWQQEVIDILKSKQNQFDLSQLLILNPRRDNFDMNEDPENQITWQFYHILRSNIFSMFFCGNTESLQPICLFEYGKEISNINQKNHRPVIVTCQNSYKRIDDVNIQTKLMNPLIKINSTVQQHTNKIIEEYLNFKNKYFK